MKAWIFWRGKLREVEAFATKREALEADNGQEGWIILDKSDEIEIVKAMRRLRHHDGTTVFHRFSADGQTTERMWIGHDRRMYATKTEAQKAARELYRQELKTIRADQAAERKRARDRKIVVSE